jgi:hypothetical protein
MTERKRKCNEKKRKGQSGCAAGSFALCGGSDHPDLIFWLLLDQAKSNKPSAANERGKICA